jgi:hypothetical protein
VGPSITTQELERIARDAVSKQNYGEDHPWCDAADQPPTHKGKQCPYCGVHQLNWKPPGLAIPATLVIPALRLAGNGPNPRASCVTGSTKALYLNVQA